MNTKLHAGHLGTHSSKPTLLARTLKVSLALIVLGCTTLPLTGMAYADGDPIKIKPGG